MMDDAELLRSYVRERSQDAFTELVRRHVNLVYFAALRRVGGDAHLADDVAQSVFADLARKAPSLQERSGLTGWLYTSTRFAAAQLVRGERRRRTHEQEAQTMHELQATPDVDWNQLRPVIDEALDELDDHDREAVLLRFFENQPLAAVGARFSLSADAARMRVERALDKLRGLLERRGIASTSAALATVFTSQSGMMAPAGIVARIVASVSGQAGAAATVTTLATWKIVAGLAAGMLGLGVVAYQAWTPANAGAPAHPSAVVAQHVSPTVAARVPVAAPPADLEATVEVPAPATEPAVPVREASQYAGLTDRQKSILKMLWEHRKIAPQTPPSGWSFKPGRNAPDLVVADFAAAVDLLQSQGLVGVHANLGTVFLTNVGDAFCRAHADEIDAFQAKPGAYVPGKFAALPAGAKDILKTLWEHQKESPDRPPQRWGFRVDPAAPEYAAFEAAVAGLREVNGLVGVGDRTGVVYLTDRGRTFCEAHADEIDAYPAPARVFRPLVPQAAP
jgi:RNA polymerase sigma factor (sigma-70 family)